MNASNMNAVVSGAFVYWDAGITSQSVIHSKLESLGLEQFSPNPRSANEALTLALLDWGNAEIAKMPKHDRSLKRKVIVQPRLNQDSNGLELMRVDRRAEKNEYEFLCAARVENGYVIVTDGYASASYLQEGYQVYKSECTGSAVGQSLVEILKHYHGTCVRAAGGLYYLPDDVVDEWDMVSEAFEQASKSNVVHRVRIVMDEQAARSVRSAITNELVKEAGIVAEELRTLQKDDAIELRKARASMLRDKCRKYESILKDTLIEVNAVLDLAEMGLSASEAVDADSNEFAGMLD